MTPIGMVDQSDEQRREYEIEAVRIIESAAERGITLRLLGSLAFHLQCPQYGYLQQAMGRSYTDIDFAAYRKEAASVAAFFEEMGYREEAEVNIIYAGERMIYHHPTIKGFYVDVFFDRLNFCHEINWVDRLDKERFTLPFAEMLMEKMQIVKINEKDVVDTIMFLLEHPLGDHDEKMINIRLISGLCAKDWGLWRTLTMNLGKVARLAQSYEELSNTEKNRITEQVENALGRLNGEPKTLSWKLRAKVGERVKWYQDVDEVS